MNNLEQIINLDYATTGGLHISNAKENLSVAYVKAMCAAACVNFSTVDTDNESNDITLVGQNFNGKWKRPRLIVQLKTTSKLSYVDHDNQQLHYPLSIKNYNDLRETDDLPKILVVLLCPENNSEWVHWSALGTKIRFSAYWVDLAGKQAVPNKSTVTVQIPLEQEFNSITILELLNHHSERGVQHV